MDTDELKLLADRVTAAGACLQSSTERVNKAESLLGQAHRDMERDRKILLDARRDLDRLLLPTQTYPDAKTKDSAPGEWGVAPPPVVPAMPPYVPPMAPPVRPFG